MITNNFEILNNINPSSFNFNQNRHHQNQDSSLNPQPSNSDLNNNLNNNLNNKTSNVTASTSSSKSFHHYVNSSTTIHEKEVGGDETSNSINKKENNDIDYSLIVRINIYIYHSLFNTNSIELDEI